MPEINNWKVNKLTPSVILTPHGRISINWRSSVDDEIMKTAEETASLIVERINNHWQCPKCKVEFVNLQGECPVCYYRTMAANYGVRMSEYFKALKLIAEYTNPDNNVYLTGSSIKLQSIAQDAINSYVHFNFIEIYSDCLLMLMKSGEFFERAINYDLPDEIVPDLIEINKLMKDLISKYESVS